MPATIVTNKAATFRTVGLSLCILGLGILSPSCTSERIQVTDSPAEPAPGMPAIDPPKATPTARAEELVTAGTEALARQAVADHELTPQERALVGVFWAGILVSQRTGEIPREFLETGLTRRVMELASSYPSFFTVDGAGAIQLLNISSPVRCEDNCLPSWQAIVGTALSTYSVVQHVRGIVPINLPQEVLAAFVTALKAGATPAHAVMVAASGGRTDKLVEAVGGALISGAALVTIGTSVAPAVATVGAIWSGFWIGANVTKAALDFQRCRSFQSANCCEPTCAAPVDRCQGNSVVTITEMCENRVCIPSTNNTRSCAPPVRACNGLLLTMTTESCAVGACASSTSVVEDCASQPTKPATCASATQRTTYTPTCKPGAGAPSCDYAETTTACPAGQTCDTGVCRCSVNGAALDPVGTWRLLTVDGAAPGTCDGPAAGFGAQTYSFGADGSFSNYFCQLNSCPNSNAQTCSLGPQPSRYQVASCVNLTINQPGSVASGRFVYNAGRWELHTGSAGFPQYVFVK